MPVRTDRLRQSYRTALALSLSLALLSPGLSRADSRDQKAADLYEEARDLIRKGDHKKGAQLLKQAIDRGATEPVERQGSETRYLAERYDPYYWLGRAQMELGLDDQALLSFEKSESFGVIKGWKEEWTDLSRRRALLLAKRPPPTPTPGLALAAATPVPTAHVAVVVPPTPVPALPTPTQVVVALVVPTRAAGPAVSPAAASEPPEKTALRALREEYAKWMTDPVGGGSAREVLASRTGPLDALLSRPASPAALAAALAKETAFRTKEAVPALRRDGLLAGLAALQKHDFAAVALAVGFVRVVDPAAPQPDILECAAFGSQYLLEGRRSAALVDRARRSLAAWRLKVGKDALLPPLLSPALRDVLK